MFMLAVTCRHRADARRAGLNRCGGSAFGAGCWCRVAETAAAPNCEAKRNSAFELRISQPSIKSLGPGGQVPGWHTSQGVISSADEHLHLLRSKYLHVCMYQYLHDAQTTSSPALWCPRANCRTDKAMPCHVMSDTPGHGRRPWRERCLTKRAMRTPVSAAGMSRGAHTGLQHRQQPAMLNRKASKARPSRAGTHADLAHRISPAPRFRHTKASNSSSLANRRHATSANTTRARGGGANVLPAMTSVIGSLRRPSNMVLCEM